MRRYIIPVALIGLCLWFMVGCFYLPLPDKPVGGEKDPRQFVGDENSKKPLRENVATREQVIQTLGKPLRVSADGNTLTYEWITRGGVWVFPLCFTTTDADRDDYTIDLIFDQGGTLRHFSVVKKHIEDENMFGLAPFNSDVILASR